MSKTTQMKSEKILLDHGSGGKISHRLTADLLLPAFDNPVLAQLDDGAVLNLAGGRLAFSTDSYVVDPIFFPGGDIGKLAVCGTVNDLAMAGARPVALSTAFVLDEGLQLEVLDRVARSMGGAAAGAGASLLQFLIAILIAAAFIGPGTAAPPVGAGFAGYFPFLRYRDG